MKVEDFDYFKPIQGVDGQNPPAAAEDFDIRNHVTDAESVNPPDQNGLSGLPCQTTVWGDKCIPITSKCIWTVASCIVCPQG